jgi:hypothetical protein
MYQESYEHQTSNFYKDLRITPEHARSWQGMPALGIREMKITCSKRCALAQHLHLDSLREFVKSCSLCIFKLLAPPDNTVFDQVVMTLSNFTFVTVFTLSQTDISYCLPPASRLTVTVYNVLGRRIKTI